MTCLGALEKGERGDDNETSLKEKAVIEMSTTVLHSRAAPSLKYSPLVKYTNVNTNPTNAPMTADRKVPWCRPKLPTV